MSTTLPADLSCPRCGAHVRTGSDWCTLCYTDLRPADQRPAVPAAEPVAPAARAALEHAADAAVPDVPATATPTAVAATPDAPAALTSEVAPEQQARGKHARKPAPDELTHEPAAGATAGAAAAPDAVPVPSRPSPAEVDALAAPLLAQLAATESGAPLGRFSNVADTSAKKAALVIGGGITAMLLLFALMALLGVFV